MEDNKKRKYYKHFDLSEEFLELNKILFLESKEKGEIVTNTLKEEILKNRNIPHRKAVATILNKAGNEKILEEFYDMYSLDDTSGNIYLGIIDGVEKIKKDTTVFSYNTKRNMYSRRVVLKFSVNPKKEEMNSINTTPVPSGSILRCDKGEGTIILKSSSQNIRKIDTNNELTEGDNKKGENLQVLDMVCSKSKEHDCINRIVPLVKWKDTSKTKTVKGEKLLTSSSYCICSHNNGKITIEKPEIGIKVN